MKDDKPDVVSFTVHTNYPPGFAIIQPKRGDRTSLTYTHCHKTGHDELVCFELHCKPNWWYEKYGKKSSCGRASSSSSVATV